MPHCKSHGMLKALLTVAFSTYRSGADVELHGFADADWGSCPETRRSIGAEVAFLLSLAHPSPGKASGNSLSRAHRRSPSTGHSAMEPRRAFGFTDCSEKSRCCHPILFLYSTPTKTFIETVHLYPTPTSTSSYVEECVDVFEFQPVVYSRVFYFKVLVLKVWMRE